MKFLTTATLNWFNDGCCDIKYLDEWCDVPINYDPQQSKGTGWHTDHYEEVIGNDPGGGLFRQAADLLMRYQFYPPQIMNHISDFELENRPLQVGDRVAQRIHIWSVRTLPVLDAIGMIEIYKAFFDARACGFTYVTVATHIEQGEWSAGLQWQQNGDVRLTVHAVSRPAPQEPARNHRFIRAFQKKAHRFGIAYFKQLTLQGAKPQLET